MLMNPKIRPIDGRKLLMTAKHDIEALLKQRQETVEVDLAQFLCSMLTISCE